MEIALTKTLVETLWKPCANSNNKHNITSADIILEWKILIPIINEI